MLGKHAVCPAQEKDNQQVALCELTQDVVVAVGATCLFDAWQVASHATTFYPFHSCC
jgi:hypothetical protein